MNPKIKQKWIEELRSKKYSQTKGELHNHEGYCCLGVLCDIYSNETGVQWEQKDRLFPGEFAYKIHETEDYLPKQVIKWAEIQSIESFLELAEKNDSGMTFEKISHIIEEQF